MAAAPYVDRRPYHHAVANGFVVRGALIVDGTGAPGFVGDVQVDDDRIVAVERAGSRLPGRVIDAAGLVLAPGFIDSHTHDDFAVVVHPDMGFKVQGGVTTCVVGNCGMGAAPWPQASLMARVFHPGADIDAWDGYRGYLDRVGAEPPAVNVAALIGHGTVRGSVLQRHDRAPTARELDAMKRIVQEGLDAGCVGMSTGLIYEPGKFAATDELVELAAVVAAAGGVYTSHIRDEGDGLLDAVDEAIEIGRRAGVPVVISHLKATGEANWGRVVDALARIDDAGPTVAADQYPYTAGSTILATIVADGLGARAGPESIVVASTDAHPEWHGRTLAELAADLGVGVDDVAPIVLAAEPMATAIVHSMSEDDVRTVMAHRGIMIGSDGIPTLDGQPHPRLYGTFARVLGRYRRDEGVLGLEDAVHRMTGRTAAVFGLAERGEIRPGAFADLVLFDADRIIDVGTYDDPHHPPAGIEGVWVNGVRVVDAGAHLGTRPGRALRRACIS
jgi:N-acyl-D-amino-acid deacylase